ncbi:MAG TPA: S1 RNA-binding domain-containing protein, partial [Candidatus Sumerlaeota bacterium]|nr:S1 RNA-binding domain-containing protein [Candidatus Sumerlaeota bacterium]
MAELEKDFTPSENTELPEDSIPEAELESEEADKDFLQLMDEYMPKVETLEVGEVREVPVLEIRPDCVLVDVGDKMEGLIDIAEFMTKKGEVTVSPGDLVEVMIEGRD